MRNQLYKNRMEICINDSQKRMIKEMKKMEGKTGNEIIREAIEERYGK